MASHLTSLSSRTEQRGERGFRLRWFHTAPQAMIAGNQTPEDAQKLVRDLEAGACDDAQLPRRFGSGHGRNRVGRVWDVHRCGSLRACKRWTFGWD